MTFTQCPPLFIIAYFWDKAFKVTSDTSRYAKNLLYIHVFILCLYLLSFYPLYTIFSIYWCVLVKCNSVCMEVCVYIYYIILYYIKYYF